MSDFTTQNPFNSTANSFPAPPTGSPIRGFTKFLFILYIVFGVLGIGSGCMGVLQLMILSAAATVSTPVHDHGEHGPADVQVIEAIQPVSYQAESDAEVVAEPAEQWGEDEEAHSDPLPIDMNFFPKEAFPGAYYVQMGLLMVSVIVSVFMLIGGILGLKGSLTGLEFVRWTSAFMIPFKMVETTFGIVTVQQALAGVREQLLKDTPDMDPEMQSVIANSLLYISVGTGIVFGLAMVLLYVIAFLHTSKPSVRALFK